MKTFDDQITEITLLKNDLRNLSSELGSIIERLVENIDDLQKMFDQIENIRIENSFRKNNIFTIGRMTMNTDDHIIGYIDHEQ